MKNKLTVFTSAVTLLLVLVVMCSYQLKVDQIAIVTTLGKTKAIKEPGLYFRMPWPIQKLRKLDVRKQLYSGNERETLTNDGINIIVKLFISWSVDSENPLNFYQKVGDSVEEAEKQLKSFVESTQEVVIRSYKLSDFHNSSGEVSKIQEIEDKLTKELNSVTREKYGIIIHKSAITRLSLHEKNSESVLARMKQEQEKIASEIRSKAEKEAQFKKNKADEEKAKILATSEAISKKSKDEVLVKSTELFNQRQEDQEFATFLREISAIKEIIKADQKSTIFLNPDIGPFGLFKVEEKEDKPKEENKTK
ncbi:MAG: SPFH domain-containing protein [Lentisphaeraceae bacterium]|nr:SPFH domain-containing protein [Lentisphaeraceae bacterium]